MEPAPVNRVTGERRRITALFADVVGSTRLAESMDPEDWAVVINPIFDAMAEAVERYEGTVTQFGGDSIVAVFGAPRTHEDDPWRAVQAALDMMTAVERLSRQHGTDVQIRAGVNTGLAVAGAIGKGSHSEYTALGDPMNVAARMQAAAPPGSVFITADTYRLIGPDVDVRDAGLLEVKGKSAPIHAYEVLGSRRAPTRARGVPGLRSPMVGRQEELAALESLVDIAAAGRGRVALVVGEPGIGKSRLLRELQSAASSRQNTGWVVGRCVSYGQRMPYHLLISMVGALLGAVDSDDPESVARAITERGGDLMGSEASALEDLAKLTGSVDEGGEGDPTRRAAYQRAIATLIQARASHHDPLVLVCEDVHWADPSSAEVLAELIPECHNEPLLLILVTRADRAAPGWAVIEAARQNLGEALTEITLHPLGDEHARAMVAHLLEIEALPDDLRALMLDKAEGNPFFVEEVVRMLIEREAIERHGDRWMATEAMTALDVPDTVEALIASRIDRLPDEARRTARLASVVGRHFSASLLDELDPSQDSQAPLTHPQLGVLEAHGLVRLTATRPELEYGFRHALVHEVVYGSLLRSERRELHRTVGEALERRHAENPDEIAEILAHHFEEAHDSRAVHYLMKAGWRALARFANREAFDFLERASRRLVADDEESRRQRVESALGRDKAGVTFLPLSQHVALLEEALEDAAALADPEMLVGLHLGLVRARLEMGESYDTSPELRKSIDTALDLANELDDPGLVAMPAARMGDVRFVQADFESAIELWGRAVPELERAANLVDASYYAGRISRALATVGRFPQAEEWVARSTRLAEASGDPNAQLDADLFAGWLEADRGNLIEAHRFTCRAIEIADEVGNVACSLVGNMLAGTQQLAMGDPVAAVSYLEKGGELAAYCEMGPDVLAFGKACLANARTQLGSPSLVDLDEALDATRQAQSPLTEGQILRQRAAVRLVLPDPDVDAAIADFEAAEATFDKIGARAYLAPTLREHGEALEQFGRPDEAMPPMHRAATLFQEMGLDQS